MNKIIKKTIGFSLLELVIVIAIVGIMVAVASPLFRESQRKVMLEGAQASLVGSLEEARSRALTGVGEDIYEIHGICINYDNNEVYSCSGTADWEDAECNCSDCSLINLEPITTNPNISLIQGGPDDIKVIEFERLNGKSNETYVRLENNVTGDYTKIKVDENGIVTIEE